ncbi:cupin domain-containing protein [Francisella sp. SYW-9]|uniref:cupin domain-containing protein n=1 Tax=Francisella sp. SYW-9 TaxID=2610888 RepID=UPI00168D74F9|nr:cupin domain-containing protein [Francisella sp. SYW-9]
MKYFALPILLLMLVGIYTSSFAKDKSKNIDESSNALSKAPRLVVVDSSHSGESVVAFDGKTPMYGKSTSGAAVYDMWISNDLEHAAMLPKAKPVKPNFDLKTNSAIFLSVVIPPLKDLQQKAKQEGKSIPKTNYPFHNTTTIDYGVVIKGEVELVTDKKVVKLHTGDTFVIKGAVHTWINPTNQPAQLVETMVGSKLKSSIKHEKLKF